MMSNPMGSEKAAKRAPHLGGSPNWIAAVGNLLKNIHVTSDKHII